MSTSAEQLDSYYGTALTPLPTPGRLSALQFQQAMLSQSACNLSGIVHSLSRIMDDIWAEARIHGKGTDWVNKHPICRLFAEQILYLSGGGSSDSDTYGDAYKVVNEVIVNSKAGS